ncbi:MAG: hypothetical protein ACTSV5_11725 [Promethearchaeota archaeon]
MAGIISELLEVDKEQLKEKIWWITVCFIILDIPWERCRQP